MPHSPLSRLHPLWIAAALALPAPGLAADKPAATQAWVLTFHYGGGSLSMNADSLDRGFGLGPDLRLGHVLDRGYVAGFQIRSWNDSEEDTLRGPGSRAAQLSRSIQIMTMTGTWFPRGPGLYVRGGGGVATVRSEFVVHNLPAPSVAVTRDDFGFAASAAAGWEQRIGRRLGAALDVEYARVLAPHVKGNLISYGLGLNYYW